MSGIGYVMKLKSVILSKKTLPDNKRFYSNVKYHFVVCHHFLPLFAKTLFFLEKKIDRAELIRSGLKCLLTSWQETN
jgi:hypothetical protein